MRRKLTETEVVELRDILRELIGASEEGAVIIVEGPSDRESLRNLGIKGEIILASTRPDVDLVDSIDLDAEVIIMSDWDSEGKKIEKRLDRMFRSRGTIVNTEFRKRIFKIVGKDVKSIEGLSRYLESIL